MYFIPQIVFKVWTYWSELKELFPNYQQNSPYDLLFSCILGFLFYQFKKHTQKYVFNFYRPRLVDKYAEPYLSQKLEKINASLFKFLFSTLSFIYGYHALKTIPGHSASLWGAGDVWWTFVGFPMNENSFELKCYYIIGFSYHLQNTASHFLTNPHETYFEMLLHHLATMMLMIFSYSASATHSGI